MMIQIISFGKGGLLNINFKPSVVFLYCLPKPLGDDAKTISHLQLYLVLFLPKPRAKHLNDVFLKGTTDEF